MSSPNSYRLYGALALLAIAGAASGAWYAARPARVQRASAPPVNRHAITDTAGWLSPASYQWCDANTLQAVVRHEEPAPAKPRGDTGWGRTQYRLVRLTPAQARAQELAAPVAPPSIRTRAHAVGDGEESRPPTQPCVSFSPDGRWVVSLSVKMPYALLFDTHEAKPAARQIPLRPHTAGSVVWSADSRRFVLFSREGEALQPVVARATWVDPLTGSRVVAPAPPEMLDTPSGRWACVMPDDHTLISADARAGSRVVVSTWEMRAPYRLRARFSWPLPNDRTIERISLSPDGGKLLYALDPEGGVQLQAVFNPETAILGGARQFIELWAADLHGRNVRRAGSLAVPRHEGVSADALRVQGLQWMPGGKRISFAWLDTLWDAPVN